MVLASQQKNVKKGAEVVQDRVPMVMVSVVLVNYSLDCCLFLSKDGAPRSKLSLLHKNGGKNC